MTGTFRWQHTTTEPANRLQVILENPRFERFIIGAIVINGITLGLETSSTVMMRVGTALHVLDHLLLAIFLTEIVSKMVVYRRAFWRDPWSVFALAVISITMLPATDNLSILRACAFCERCA